MKKLLFVILCVWGVAEAQNVPKYTWIAGRYNYLATATNDLLAPAGSTVARGTDTWNRSGALMYDSTGTDTGLYVYHRPYWVKVGGGISSVIGTPLQAGFFDETTGVLTGNDQFQFRRAENPASNASGMLRVGYNDGVAGGLGPEIPLYTYSDDIGFVKRVHKNFYDGTANGAAVGDQFLDAWGKATLLYQGTYYNAFAPGGLLIDYTGGFQRYNVDSAAGFFSWGTGALQQYVNIAINEEMRLGPDYLNVKSDSVRTTRANNIKPITDSAGWLFIIRNKVTGTEADAYWPAGGSSITAGYGLSGTTTFILDTTIAVNKAGEQVIPGHKIFTAAPNFTTLTANQLMFAGTAGVVSGSTGLTYNATTFNVAATTGTSAIQLTSQNSSFNVNHSMDNSANYVINSSGDYFIRRVGNALLTLGSTVAIFNDGALNVDLRAESQTNANAIFLDASANTVGLGTGTPHSTGHINGSFATAYRAIAALRTLDLSDHTIEATTGTYTVTLPTAVGISGRQYTITNSGTGVVTIGTTSSQTFANQTGTPTTITLNQFYSATVVSNGANWLLLASIGF